MPTTQQTEPAELPKGRLLRGIEAIFAQVWRWGALYLLIAISPGLALWPLSNMQALRYIVKNDLTIGQRGQVLATIAASFVVTTAVYFAVWWRRRRSEPGLGLGTSIVETNRWAFILLAAPMVSALSVVRIEVKYELFTSFLMVAVTALAMVFIYRALGLRWLAPKADPFVPARLSGLAKATFLASTIGYIACFSYFSILDHHNLGTSVYDLGIYDNLVWQTAHGFFLDCTLIKGGNHVSAHFDPILWLVGMIYLIYQHAETLLVLQTVWLASAALPLWLLAMHRLRNEWMAAILVGIYFLHPGLHGVNMFDFHSLGLIVPLVMWAAYLLDVGALRRYWLVFALLMITREDISIVNCFLGAYAILLGRTRTGLVTIFLSIVYLAGVKLFVMADSSLLMAEDKAYSYVYFYEEMIPHGKEGARGLFTTLLINPLYALQIVFKQEKLLFFFHLLLPLLALPFVAGRKLVLMIYGLLFLGLASRQHLFSLHYQYSALLFPMLFTALPDAVGRVADSRRLRALGLERARVAWTLVLTMLVSSLLVSSKYGAIFPNASFVAGWTRLAREPSPTMIERYKRVQEMVAQIGPDAAVSVSNELGPHVSNRRKAYHWPTINDAQYLFVFVDTFTKEEKKRLDRLVQQNKFRLLDEALGVKLLGRVDEEELPEEFRAEERGQNPKESKAPLTQSEETGGESGDGREGGATPGGPAPSTARPVKLKSVTEPATEPASGLTRGPAKAASATVPGL